MHRKKVLHEAAFHIPVVLFGIVMIYPLLWMLMSSFKEGTEIFQSASFWPSRWITENYSYGWSGISGYSFAVFLKNSFIIVFVVMVGNVLSCSLTAYAFSKLNFPLRSFWFAIMMGTLMLPMHVRLIPQYIIYNQLGWVNTYLPLTVAKFFGTEGFFIFMMTQYMRGLPRELDEASRA